MTSLKVDPLQDSYALTIGGEPTPPPLLSVVLTVFRRTQFLPQALRSALTQTLADLEIIVADDSGNAAAAPICAPLVATRQVRYHANHQTLGVAASLQAAITSARGTYVAILNDDDVWDPTLLERLVAALEADARRVLAFSDHWIITENGDIDQAGTVLNTRRYGRSHLAEGEISDPAKFVLAHNGVPLAMASVFRRAAIDLGLLTTQVGGAYDFWISCLLATSGTFYYVPERLASYRVHASMETGRRGTDISMPNVYIATELLKHDWFPQHRRRLRRMLASSLRRVGWDYLEFGRVPEARRWFARAVRARAGWRSLAALLVSLSPRQLHRWLRADETARAARQRSYEPVDRRP